MLQYFLFPVQHALRRAARRAVFGTVAGLLMLVGAAFLTLAAWIYLASVLGIFYAALVLGLVFVGIGLIVLAIGLRPPRYRHPPPPVAQPTTLVSAFLSGIAAGQGLRRK
ncbi:phage holin family protein [Oceaniglobus roseus]|uniref:phage holin family protein n=1 Tax=Oceaniglobus roseus TaxID=1737570 RepID=UPI000C7EC08A|nr:phage holin family protein [Kandeliimicrobium roseum]